MDPAIGELSEWLHARLQQPLPGPEAQYRLAPAGRRARVEAKPLHIRPREGAVLILLFGDGTPGEIHFPLILRPSYEGVHSGQVALPGGKKEEQDASLEMTALRETAEEIGINPEQVRVLGRLTELYIPPSNFEVAPYVGIFHGKPDFYPDPHEVEKIFHFSLEHLKKGSSVIETKIRTSRDLVMRVPGIEIEDQVIWGATAMILSEFAELLREKPEK